MGLFDYLLKKMLLDC